MEPAISTAETSLKTGTAISIGSFSNSFARLPERFFVRQAPTPVSHPAHIVFNEALAAELGLDVAALNAAETTAIFAGNILPAGAMPVATAYAGHQFGNFVPQLGDGRAILLGEVIDRTGIRRDIQLKGAGRSAFSRGGDGRAALGPVLREYLVSESMHALGVPSTRALAAVTTGDRVFREQALPGAVLTRIAASNVRVGTFQYFAARGDTAAIKCLADYVIDRHYPHLQPADAPYRALLEAVVEKQAALIARWMTIGFIHGVMNTDNMAISGETIDYGPCAFMDAYDPATVFSSIDQFGRYAYANQPRIAQWNLARFAETLLPFFDADEKRAIAVGSEIINGFSARFDAFWLDGMRRKIGLCTAEDEDPALIQNLLDIMQRDGVDFTLLFRRLGESLAARPSKPDARELFQQPESFDRWAISWRRRLGCETLEDPSRALLMNQINPAFIPRNHLVEQALAAAVGQANFQPFHELLRVLQNPFEDQPAFAHFGEAPLPGGGAYRTFCGT